MAISNRDRVNKGFEILADGLSNFVDVNMTKAFKSENENWIAIIENRDEAKNGFRKNYELNDPAFLLRMITDEWRIFGKFLSRAQQSLASELREVRNKFAHNEKFSSDAE